MYKKIIQNKKGSVAIISTMLMLFSILIMVIMGSNMVVGGIRMSRDQLDSAKVYYAAEAGAEKIIWEVRRTPGSIVLEGVVGSSNCELCYDNLDVYNGMIRPLNASGCQNTCPGSGAEHTQEFGIGLPTYTADYEHNGGKIKVTIEGALGEVRRTVNIAW